MSDTHEFRTGAQIARLENQVRALRIRLQLLHDAAQIAIERCDLLIGRPLIDGPISQEERDADDALVTLRAHCRNAEEVL
jgi:hypothetical protein